MLALKHDASLDVGETTNQSKQFTYLIFIGRQHNTDFNNFLEETTTNVCCCIEKPVAHKTLFK